MRFHLTFATDCWRSPLRQALVRMAVLLCFSTVISSGWCDPVDAEGSPHVVFKTRLGAIVVELDRAAAPHAIARWLQLVEGPVFNPRLVGGSTPSLSMGYYDGLAFSYTKPHVEVVTAGRPPLEAFQFEAQIDAAALGLHEQLIGDVGEAMNVLQRELIETYGRLGKGNRCTPQLLEWVGVWHEIHDASFLVGQSRQAINEAQGYVYRNGLRSKPVVRGSVSLQPLSPTMASARLSIALADIPQRTGKWMVLGTVVEGLDIVETIALQALEGRGTQRARLYRPLDPVVIESVDIVSESKDTSGDQGPPRENGADRQGGT